MTALEQKLRGVSSDVFTLKESMDANTCALVEYIELSKNLKVGMKLLGYVESAAVWVAKVGGATVLLWAAWKYLIIHALSEARK